MIITSIASIYIPHTLSVGVTTTPATPGARIVDLWTDAASLNVRVGRYCLTAYATPIAGLRLLRRLPAALCREVAMRARMLRDGHGVAAFAWA